MVYICTVNFGGEKMNKKKLTLGSLFDGSGGFPLGGILNGIESKWASEVEPFPIMITKKRIPNMKHLGDISKINGAEIEPVDIITFGSPCQDLSVAGKRNGLDGSRSSLFYEAIRVIKEMRCKTNGEYPRFIVWENVPGAFSSNKGADFKAVLQTIVSVKNEEFIIPEPPKGKWAGAGNIVADDFSIAWRVLDAQYFGVPQRRKRIYLVADFNSQCAGKILFEPESLSGDTKKSGSSWESFATSFKDCFGKTSYGVTDTKKSAGFCTEHSAKSRGVGFEEEKLPTLRTGVVPATVYENHSQDSRYTGPLDVAQTVLATYGTGGNNQPFVVEALKAYGVCSKESNSMKSDNPNSGFYEAETSRTVDTGGINPSSNQGGISVVCVDQGGGKSGCNFYEEQAPTLTCTHGGEPVIAVQGSMIGRKADNGPNGSGINEDVSFTLNTIDRHAVAVPTYSMTTGCFMQVNEEKAPTLAARDYKDPTLVGHIDDNVSYVVRRLTPTECALLQGFPTWWCSNLAIKEPTEEEIKWWSEVFETHRKIIGKSSKPKTRKQIIKWLKNPHSDSAEYKMWGNGVALPCVCFVLERIVYYTQNSPQNM